MVEPRRGIGGKLTDAGHDEEDEEGVEHGKDGLRDGVENLPDRLDAGEEAQHPEGAEAAQHAGWDVDGTQGDQGHGDDEEVEEAPGVGEELLPPARKHVAGQLHREDGGEGIVEIREEVAGPFSGPVLVGKALFAKLGVDGGSSEVLHRR